MIEDEFINFSKPSISKAELKEVTDCLESGWLTTGPRVTKFESDLKKYFRSENVLALSSATAGLQLSLQGIGLKKNDEVITTPITFVATTNTIVHAGAKPVMVDVDPGTYNIDVNKIEDAITERTKAIVPVHFAGLPVDLDPLYDLAKEYNLRVIEDAAHSIGSCYKGKIIGGFGDTQVFSFHPNKNMTTGEGGCVSTSDENLAKNISLMSFHGIEREVSNPHGKVNQHYHVVAPGFKYNMMDIQASLGIHQLKRLDLFIEKRRKLAEKYREVLSDWDEFKLPEEPIYSHKNSWHLFCPLLINSKSRMNRDRFIEEMKSRGVGLGIHYEAIHLHPYYQKEFGYRYGDFPNAEKISASIMSLPLYPDLTDSQQQKVINKMQGVLNS